MFTFACRSSSIPCSETDSQHQDGEPTDPPPAQTPPVNPRYARPIPRAPSPVSTSDSTLFCQTCLKNQALLTQNLANYLPAPSNPRYAEYEASYPEYRRQLEERYPQVCAHCEPRVRQKIHKAGYAAKADHLRRVMERAKYGRHAAEKWRRRWWAWVAGGLLWANAAGGHIVFNSLGALALEEAEMRDDSPVPPLRDCLELAYRVGQVGSQCVVAARPLVGGATLLAFLSIWWNPTMGRRTTARARGLVEFYQIQTVLLLVRLLNWYLFREGTELHIDHVLARAIHAVMLAFNIVVSVLRLPKIPLIS